MKNHTQLFHFMGRSLIANARQLPFPMKLNYVLTYRCNAQCIMCNIWKKPKNAELTVTEIEKFFFNSNKFSWIDLSGGEIFLRPDLQEVTTIISRYCKNLFLFHFATNGILTETIVPQVEKIIKLKIPKILMTVSIDGHPQLHDRMRGMPGAFDKAIKTFQKLRSHNSRSFQVFIGMTLTEHNMHEVEKSFNAIKQVIKDIRYDELHINIVQRSNHYYDNMNNAPCVNEKELYSVIESIRKKRGIKPFSPVAHLEDKYLRLAKTFLETKRSPLPCQALSVSCFMDPCGNIYPCNTYDKMIGNIKEYNYQLAALLKSQKAKETINDIMGNKCPQCWTPCEAYQTIIANFFGLRRG